MRSQRRERARTQAPACRAGGRRARALDLCLRGCPRGAALQRWLARRSPGGGLLAGRRFLDPDSRSLYIEVEGLVPMWWMWASSPGTCGCSGRRPPPACATTSRTPRSSGWYLGVPGEDRRPGPDEVALHETFFTQPWQRGLWVPARGTPVGLAITGGTFSPEVVAAVSAGQAEQVAGS
ncbi:MAG: hypothetical protein R3F43_28045 [bacterium]